MTFADTRRAPEQTIVFFPGCLARSLHNALRKENLTGWKILRWPDVKRQYGVDCPRDEAGHPAVRIYEDVEGTTNDVRALVSGFDEEILDKIYRLHYDPDACAYRYEQSKLLTKALIEDGFIDENGNPL